MSYTFTTHSVDTPALCAGWVELLSWPAWDWSWFVTLTYKREVKPESADRDFKRWIGELNRHRFGRRYRERGQGLSYARAIEYTKRGVLHYHALIGHAGRLRRFDAMANWEKTGTTEWFRTANGKYELKPRTGFARIYEYDPTLGATHYVSKYVAKNGEITVGYDQDTGVRLRSRSAKAEPVQQSMFDVAQS